MNFSRKQLAVFVLLILLFAVTSFAESPRGIVYLVLGSDTAIWEGMDVGRFNCYYHRGLYLDPARNANRVMDPAFRARFLDSYGQPMKLTWWMMAGNIFRHAANTNVPHANVMTIYLMKKYYADQLLDNGDELSLHYHTFKWTDYDNDGLFWWNQALTFEECRADFDYTLAQLLIEEQVFPVSFRSGWHYMDNAWQQYLDQLLPYSLHNDWPNQRTDSTEPLDNTYDWSQAPGRFVPYRPSWANYQEPGNGPGWNVRSTHLYTTRYRDLIDSLFARAYDGANQLACLWGHLPEADFLSNLEIIDSLARRMETRYPGVHFRYCTAVEAMQRWRGRRDTIPPALTVEQTSVGERVFLTITTDEPIFQPRPFVAVKNIYEEYRVLSCRSSGINQWETVESLSKTLAARAAVAVCDTLGNQTLAFIDFRPQDIYIDNLDKEYLELFGNWSSTAGDGWGSDYRIAVIPPKDSAGVRWHPAIREDMLYNIQIQLPPLDSPVADLTFKVFDRQVCRDTIYLSPPLTPGNWIYLTTVHLSAGGMPYLEMLASNPRERTVNVGADVVKFSALVRERDIHPSREFLDFGEIVAEDTAYQTLVVSNHGISTLTIRSLQSKTGFAGVKRPVPIQILPMSSVPLDIFGYASDPGILKDTLLIYSDDPVKSELRIPLSADVQHYFRIVDNDDSLNYKEFGNWAYSNAQAFGASSRYAYLHQNPEVHATFSTSLEKSGIYEILEIVPLTENAADNAQYRFSLAGGLLDSVYVNQNQGSGDWLPLGRYYLPAGVPVEVRVIDTGESTAGVVLRADAIKFTLLQEIAAVNGRDIAGLPHRFELLQNYPNPFNASTTFRYVLAVSSKVEFKIYNAMGQLVASLAEERQSPGLYELDWDAQAFASGIYFARLQAGHFVQTRKVLLIK